MSSEKVLGLRTLNAAGRRVSVVIFKNESGTVSARCMVSENDTPIVDGADEEEALATLKSALEGILLARDIE